MKNATIRGHSCVRRNQKPPNRGFFHGDYPVDKPMRETENGQRDMPVITQEMIDAGVAAYLRLDPEDSWDRLVREIFVAMSAESPSPSHEAQRAARRQPRGIWHGNSE